MTIYCFVIEFLRIKSGCNSMVECQLPKLKVASSILVTRSKILMIEKEKNRQPEKAVGHLKSIANIDVDRSFLKKVLATWH